jgi:hypothetical protein
MMQRVHVRLVKWQNMQLTCASELERISRSAVKLCKMLLGESLCVYCVLQGSDVSLLFAVGLNDVRAQVIDVHQLRGQPLQLLLHHVR